MGRRLKLLVAGLGAGLAAAWALPVAAQLYSPFADYDVPVYCGHEGALSWVTTLGVARAPDTTDPTLYRELLGRAARDALRARGHRVDDLPSCFFDDPALPRSRFNQPQDALRAQWQDTARRLRGARMVTRLDVPEPVDPETRPRAAPLPGARQSRTVAGAASPSPTSLPPQTTGSATASALPPPREVVGPAAAAALLPPARSDPAVAQDETADVRALNDAILARHAAVAEEARRREAAFAEERRRHQAVVEAANQRDRQYQQELARIRAAEEQYRRDLAAHEAVVRAIETGRSQPVEWREAVVVCSADASGAQAQSDLWRCVGPERTAHTRVATIAGAALDPQVRASLGETCGGEAAAVRDLGMVGSHRVFGCGFGLNPTGARTQVDAAAQFGLADIPGRITFRCAVGADSCRNR